MKPTALPEDGPPHQDDGGPLTRHRAISPPFPAFNIITFIPLEKCGLLPDRINFTLISDLQSPDVIRKSGKLASERLIVTGR
jgi:hypothetical protein